MKAFSNDEVEKAISEISEKLGVTIDEVLKKEYQNGKHHNLLSYEKVEKADIKIPAIQKYLIGAQTYLDQPCQFYDIFRLCRHVILIQRLNDALAVVMNSACNFKERRERLRREVNYDRFEAVLYEMVVAANYCGTPSVGGVTFLEFKSSEAPDIEVIVDTGKMYIECKKFDRSVDLVSGLRDTVRDKVQLAINEFVKICQSAVLEISFHSDPRYTPAERIRDSCLESFKIGTPILDRDLTVNVLPLAYRKLDEPILFPSPKYYWERYAFKERDEWFGIVHPLYARFARHIDVVDSEENLISTWLDDVGWECAVKWKITDEELLWRLKRLGYNLLFKGLDQLQSSGIDTVLHVWFERDSSVGHRQNELLHFFNTLRSSARDVFAWIIFNETCFDVSVEGRYDLIEHAHIIRGPGALLNNPPVTLVFAEREEPGLDTGQFGIGYNLPDIDLV